MSLKNREGQGQGQQLQPWCSPGLPGWGRALSRAGIRQLPPAAIKELDKLQERHPTAPSVSPRSLPWLWVTLPWPASTVSIHTRQAPAPPSTQPCLLPPLRGILRGLLGPCCPETAASARLLIAAASGRGSRGDAGGAHVCHPTSRPGLFPEPPAEAEPVPGGQAGLNDGRDRCRVA